MPKLSRTRTALAALVVAVLGANAARAEDPNVPPAGCQGPASSTWINVAAEGLRNGNRLIAVTLYADDARKFLARHGSLYTGRVAARAGTTEACIFVPRPGVYAIAVYHDEDASRKLNRSGLGMPTEGFGFSNNPGMLFGIPAFRSVRINVPHPNVSTRIRLRYP